MEETTKSTHPPAGVPGRLGEAATFTVITAEEDILCREALEFAEHLIEAGVTVTVKRCLGPNMLS